MQVIQESAHKHIVLRYSATSGHNLTYILDMEIHEILQKEPTAEVTGVLYMQCEIEKRKGKNSNIRRI